MLIGYSATFNPSRTYVVTKKPKNFIGVLNYIFDRAGRKSIYQDRIMYGFVDGEVREIIIISRLFLEDKVSILEIPIVKDIKSLVGKKYHPAKFNCNHLVSYATSRS